MEEIQALGVLDVNRMSKKELAKMVKTFVYHHNYQLFKDLILGIKELFQPNYGYLVEIHPTFCEPIGHILLSRGTIKTIHVDKKKRRNQSNLLETEPATHRPLQGDNEQ